MSPGSRSPELEMRPSHKSRSPERSPPRRVHRRSRSPPRRMIRIRCPCQEEKDTQTGSVPSGQRRLEESSDDTVTLVTSQDPLRMVTLPPWIPEGKRGTRTKIQKFQEQSGRGQLLPGIPDEITLNLITTKLFWTDMHLLPSISHAWKDAVYSRQVYRARVQAHATESLYARPGCYWPRMPNMAIAIYSNIPPPKPGSFERPSRIPKVPKKKGGFRSTYTDGFFYLDGKIYAVGCLNKRSVIARIFVFDMGGKSQWTECATTQLSAKPPTFPHSVSYDLHSGKIVLKGASGNYEIYDPELNSWSSTTDLPAPGTHCEHGLNCSSRECLRGFKICSTTIVEF